MKNYSNIILEKTGYSCINDEKLNRAIFGTIGREGKLTGGVSEVATPEAMLAEYDRLGGAIFKGKYHLKLGSFYNFDERKPREVKEVKLLLRDLEGNEVEINEDEPIPVEVQAAEKIAAKKQVKKVKKPIDED